MSTSQDRSVKNLEAEERRVRRQKRNMNNWVAEISLLLVVALGFVYMWDLNSYVSTGISIVLSALYNVAASLLGWEPAVVAAISAAIKTALGIMFGCAALVAWHCNRQQR